MRLLDTLNRFYYDFSLDELRQMNNNTLYPNITYNSLLYMDIIYSRHNCTVSYLAGALHISKSAVTVKVNELIRQGLVTKTRSETDGRIHYLSVSPEVRADYSQYNKRLSCAANLLTERYSAGEVEMFCDMLDLVRECYLEEQG